MSHDPRIPYTRQDPNAPWLDPKYCIPQGGYATASDTEMGSVKIGDTKQLFYSRPIAADPFNPTPADFFNPNTKEFELDTVYFPWKGERPWLVSVNATEVYREFREGSTDQPLTSQRIQSDAGNQRYSTLQALIRVSDGSPNSKIIKIDVAGGTTIPVIGRSVQVSILAPDNAQWVRKENQPVTNALTGLVFDSLVSAKVAPMLNSNGNYDILKFTENRAVAATEAEFIEIPPSARRVRIINATTAVQPDFMYFWMTDSITGGHSMGIIDFLGPNTPNSTVEINIPVGATHIYTGTADPDNDRAFSFVFLIDP